MMNQKVGANFLGRTVGLTAIVRESSTVFWNGTSICADNKLRTIYALSDVVRNCFREAAYRLTTFFAVGIAGLTLLCGFTFSHNGESCTGLCADDRKSSTYDCATTEKCAVDLRIISKIESSNRVEACSYRGCKYGRGLYQISEVLLQDYNEVKNTHYKPQDLFNSEVNTRIAIWALNARIPKILRNKGVRVTRSSVLLSYNGGYRWIKRGVSAEGREYLRKYVRFGGVL